MWSTNARQDVIYSCNLESTSEQAFYSSFKRWSIK